MRKLVLALALLAVPLVSSSAAFAGGTAPNPTTKTITIAEAGTKPPSDARQWFIGCIHGQEAILYIGNGGVWGHLTGATCAYGEGGMWYPL